MAVEQRAHGLPLALREAGQRLVEQQHLGLLRQRHREFEPPPLAVGGLGDDALGAVAKPDLRQRLARLRRRGARWPVSTVQRIPAQLVEAEQREHDVVDERLAREQRQDLVGAGEAEMHALLRRHADQFLAEQLDRAAVGGEIAGDQVEQRGLAGAVRPDDQAALAGHHRERDVLASPAGRRSAC